MILVPRQRVFWQDSSVYWGDWVIEFIELIELIEFIELIELNRMLDTGCWLLEGERLKVKGERLPA